MFKQDILKKYIEDGLITERVHPEDGNVRIYNYTPKCQYDRIWDEVTLNCRGLIIDVIEDKVLARPFPKFFNLSEMKEKEDWSIPDEKPIITEKYDGSLGIMYTLKNKPYIATRGSFTSEQAEWATDWWRTHKGSEPYPAHQTHLFEIIYPENRIVVDYDFSGLVHLATIDNETGQQIPFTMPVNTVDEIDSHNLDALAARNTPNSEGFVVYFPQKNERVKIKFDEYVRLHKILTNITPKTIWEVLKNGDNFDDLIENVPDEFYKWVKAEADFLQEQHDRAFSTAIEEYKNILDGIRDELGLSIEEEIVADPLKYVSRKELATKISKMTMPVLGFKFLDKKDIGDTIWKTLKPKSDQGFKTDIDA